jgi:hypothetical protein
MYMFLPEVSMYQVRYNSFVTVLIGTSQLIHRKPLELTVMYRVFGDIAVITQFCSFFWN